MNRGFLVDVIRAITYLLPISTSLYRCQRLVLLLPSSLFSLIFSQSLHGVVDKFFIFQTRHHRTTFLSRLKEKLLLPQTEALQAGTRYDVPLINPLVQYIGMQASNLFPHLV
jgi:CCR4-NOT transcription complex subunit 1